MGDKAAIPTPAIVMSVSAGNPQAVAVKKTTAAKSGSKKPRAKPTHPKTAEMVTSAIAGLKERSGSSLQAIKKYIAGTFKVDTEKQSPFIKKYLRAAVASGILVQTKGKGAAGSFKLATGKPQAPKPKLKAAKLVTPKKTAVKKATAVRRSPVKKSPVKKTKVVAEKRKVAKGPAAKPPKPKTTKPKAAAKTTPKKAAPVKKTSTSIARSKRAAPKKSIIKKK